MVGDGNGFGYGDGIGDGYGYGNGFGFGYGDGYGYGNGDGYGNGFGDDNGNGDGYGYGYYVRIRADGALQVGCQRHQLATWHKIWAQLATQYRVSLDKAKVLLATAEAYAKAHEEREEAKRACEKDLRRQSTK